MAMLNNQMVNTISRIWLQKGNHEYRFPDD